MGRQLFTQRIKSRQERQSEKEEEGKKDERQKNGKVIILQTGGYNKKDGVMSSLDGQDDKGVESD